MTKLELHTKINELELEIEHWKERYQVGLKETRLECERERLGLEKELAKFEATNFQLEKRIAEAPYKLVSDILKALVVKFPTLEIKDLTVTKGKEWI